MPRVSGATPPPASPLLQPCMPSTLRRPHPLPLCPPTPAIGFNVETVTYKNLKFQVWDLGGQTSIRCVARPASPHRPDALPCPPSTVRAFCVTNTATLPAVPPSRPYWRCYYNNTDAIIYVVDSCDKDRMGISKTELVSMLEVRARRWTWAPAAPSPVQPGPTRVVLVLTGAPFFPDRRRS